MNLIALYNDISQDTSVTFKMFCSVYYGSVEKTCIHIFSTWTSWPISSWRFNYL